MFIANKYIILILVLIFILVLILVLICSLNTNRSIETYNNVLNPFTYNSNNNKKCCTKTNNENIIIPLAYNDFCNSLKEQSNNYYTPDEYNKYCVTDLLMIPEREIITQSIRQQPTIQTTAPTTIQTAPTTMQTTAPTTIQPTAPTTPTTPINPITPTNPTNPVHTPVTYPIVKPYGYGSIRGWYDTRKSSYLLDNPITIYYNQMNTNYVNSNEPWKLLNIPRTNELPNYGDWWNWTRELENINKVIDYLGNTLGKWETHIVAASELTDPLIWVKKQRLSVDNYYKISNTTLTNLLLGKLVNSNDNIVLTTAEWASCNITTNIITLHYITVDSSQYRPFSPGTDRVNNETLAIIARDWEIGSRGDPSPNLTLRVEECGGVCLNYKTKTNKQRLYMALDIGIGHYNAMKQDWFLTYSDNRKKHWLRNEIYAYISHEYTHVFQNQVIEPMLPRRWFGEEENLSERNPNAISRWWLECFAILLPFFMGFRNSNFYMQDNIRNAIYKITNTPSLTATEFSDRMMYVNPYGYLPASENMVWSFLVAAYMAKLTSWKYVLVDFYYDFQRVPSNTQHLNNGEIIYLPDLDKLFLHNFDKTEQVFLQDIFREVKNGTITMAYLSNVLPDGSNFSIPNLVKFNTSTLL